MNRTLITLGLFVFLGARASSALEVEMDKYDAAASYPAVTVSTNIIFINPCRRSAFEPYEWKTWQGKSFVRAVVMPMAEILVRRDSSDAITDDIDLFIDKAIGTCAESGGNFLCLIASKQNTKFLGIESVKFRAYKQTFQTHNKDLEAYFNGMASRFPPLQIQDLDFFEEEQK